MVFVFFTSFQKVMAHHEGTVESLPKVIPPSSDVYTLMMIGGGTIIGFIVIFVLLKFFISKSHKK